MNDEKLNKQKKRASKEKMCQSFSLLLTFRVYSLQVNYTIIEIETKKQNKSFDKCTEFEITKCEKGS